MWANVALGCLFVNSKAYMDARPFVDVAYRELRVPYEEHVYGLRRDFT